MEQINMKRTPHLTHPIERMTFLNRDSEEQHIFFITHNHMGMIKLPLEVNPFKWITTYTSGTKIKSYCISANGNFVFTISEGEGSIQVWRIMPGVMDVLERHGGQGIENLYSILGENAESQLDNLKDYFVYAHIIHQGEYDMNKREIKDTIMLCEVPDILRAMGCFLSKSEIETLLIQERDFDSEINNLGEKEITFLQLVEIYANYKNLSRISHKQLKEAFNLACGLFRQKGTTTKASYLTKDNFIKLLEECGEQFDRCETFHFLRTLLHQGSNIKGDPFSFLPDEINFEYFANEIIGIPSRKDLQKLHLTGLDLDKSEAIWRANKEREEKDEKEYRRLRKALKKMALKYKSEEL